MIGIRDRIGSLSSQRVCAAVPRLVGLALLSSLLIAAEPAATRTITLRWRHPGEVAGFKVYTRHADHPYAAGIDIGLPKQVDGVYTYRLEVSNLDATYVSMTAYSPDGTESPHSNEKLYLLPE
jgi:hypothetical protein